MSAARLTSSICSDAAEVLLYVGVTCRFQLRMKGHAADKPWWDVTGHPLKRRLHWSKR